MLKVMSKDELMQLYIDLSEKYMHNYPDEETRENNQVSDWSVVQTWKTEGKLELLKQILGAIKPNEDINLIAEETMGDIGQK